MKFAPISGLDEAHRQEFSAAKFDGVIVARVDTRSVAERAGIRAGDYIYAINGRLVTSIDEFRSAMAEVDRDAAIKIRAKRIDPLSKVALEEIFIAQFGRATLDAVESPIPPPSEVGCLGHTVETCLAVLRQGIGLSEKNIAEAYKRNAQVDVTGKRLNQSRVLVVTGEIGDSRSVSAVLRFDARGVVNEVEVGGLPGALVIAETEEDYERTKVYEAMRVIFGPSCQAAERSSLYKFFHTVVRPKWRHKRVERHLDWNGASEMHDSEVKSAPFCGRSIWVTSNAGYMTEAIDINNSSGVFMLTRIGAK